MTNLVLVHPGGAHGIYGPLGDELTALEPPLWCRLTAGYVRDRGYSVAIIDQDAEQLTPLGVAQRCAEHRPNLVAILAYGHQPSGSTQTMPAVREVSRAVKGHLGVPVLVAGGHVSALSERTLREELWVDYVAKGEGPVTICELIKANPIGVANPRRVDLEDIPGLGWRDAAGEPVINPPAPAIEMDQLHGDAWDLLPMDRYRAHNWQVFEDPSRRRPYASIMTSLNCPFACHFCCISAPFGNRVYRKRSPAAVVEEVTKLYHRYGVKTFKIVDELFVLHKNHHREICERLVATGFADDLNIWCYGRPDVTPAEDLPLMRQAGIRWLALGVEAGSVAVRAGAGKALRGSTVGNAGIEATVAAIRAAGISVIANYIFGLPDDDLASMRLTLNLAQRLNTEFANFYACQAYPGSALYDEALEKGWKLPEGFEGYSQHNKWSRPLDTKHLHASEVLRFRDEAFNKYFGGARYKAMITQRFGDIAVAEVDKMLSYKLERYLIEGKIS